jgi:2,5-diamino-6-(ribosylamino)-4(3H)-pyrimidinone 5'-phosphate reductase
MTVPQAGRRKAYSPDDNLRDVPAPMRPFVSINVAMTADGKIDTSERRGATISSAQDKERVDRLRAGSDAVMVGGRTLLDEDPKLTVKSGALQAERLGRGLPAHPARIGVVTNAALRPGANFLTAGPARVVIFTTQKTSGPQIEMLRSHGAQVIVHNGARVDLDEMMKTLKNEGIERLMVEGGGTLNFELLRRGLVDEVSAYIAPLVFGGAHAPTLADGPGTARGEAIDLELIQVNPLDEGGILVQYRVKRSK